MLTISEIINNSKVSQYLVTTAIQKGGLFGGNINRRLPRQIYCVRKNVEWLYDLNPDHADLRKVANYLYSSCAAYNLQAQAIINLGDSGTVIYPTSVVSLSQTQIGWLRITSNEFDNATDYVNATLDSVDFRLYANWIARYLEPGTEWEELPGGGFRILLSGFDATTYAGYEIYLDAKGAIIDTNTGGVAYDLSAIAVISNLSAGDSYEVRTVSIKPNGYSYTWASDFVFSDTYPPQPLAIAVDTLQVYSFRYIPSELKWVCVEQSLNIPI